MGTQTLLADDQKVSSSVKKTTCLVLSPATIFGSWGWLSDVMRYSPDRLHYEVVSFGAPDVVPPRTRIHSLKDRNYLERGAKMAKRRYFILNGLQYLPLVPKLLSVIARTRPKHLMGNGIAATAFLLPFKWVFRTKLHLAYHGYIGYMGSRWHKAIGFVLNHCDEIYVNSQGSKDDLAHVVDRARITAVDHWADPLFFQRPLVSERKPGPLRVLYVGRLQDDKFDQAHRVLNELSKEGVVQFWLVGNGPMEKDARAIPNMVDNGYISDKARLAEIYQSVDIVWTPADVTYLSRPGIEALASGTPVLAPDVVPFLGPNNPVRIPKSLVPVGCGWVVDGADDTEVKNLLRSLNSTPIPPNTHEQCRKYAETRHSVQNIDDVTSRLA